MPKDLQDGVLEAISIQALGQVLFTKWSSEFDLINFCVVFYLSIDNTCLLKMQTYYNPVIKIQGTEIQLGLAVECQKATLSVKRRLACEQLTYFSQVQKLESFNIISLFMQITVIRESSGESHDFFVFICCFHHQAYHCLSNCDTNHGHGKKHLWFIKWKFLEAKVYYIFNSIYIELYLERKLSIKYLIYAIDLYCSFAYNQAAAYYYHGLIMDKGNEPSCHISAVCCFLAAEELLAESKKACLSFCLAAPVTRFGCERL